MKLIKEILEKDIIVNSNSRNGIKYSVRKTVRAILFKNGKIAILFVSKKNYHKLPGGEIEQNESIEEALFREVLEETGCTCKIKKKIGVTIEYKDKAEVLQISYIFSAVVIKQSTKLNFTEKEKSQGYVLEWCSLDTVIDIFSKDTPKDYDGTFISVRDKAIIESIRT